MTEDRALILLVEDNPSIYKLVVYKLESSGYRVEHRENGIDGLQAVRDLKPDLVILDVMLPGKNGFELLKEVREDEDVADTNVIMLTTKSREEDLELGFELEVEDYMDKPFKPAELLMRVQKVLD